MRIDPESWHAKLYILQRCRGNKRRSFWSGEEIFEFEKQELLDRGRIDLCTYFRRAIVANFFWLIFAIFAIAMPLLFLVVNIFTFGVVPLAINLGLLLATLAVVVGVLAAIALFENWYKRRRQEKNSPEEESNIFVEKVRSVKSKTCPIMEIRQ